MVLFYCDVVCVDGFGWCHYYDVSEGRGRTRESVRELAQIGSGERKERWRG
jgi:hypothetical protein